MKVFVDLKNVPEELFNADALGGKAFNLAKMIKAGVNVPPAVVIPTSFCMDYLKDPAVVMESIVGELKAILQGFKDNIGYVPLVSVRSGAKFSMPGMMDTILNVGITPDNLDEWQERLGESCANDCLERLKAMYSSVVGEDLPGVAYKQLLGAIEAVFKSWNNERAKTYRRIHNIPDDLGTAVIIQCMVFGNLNDKSCTGVLFTRNASTGAKEIVGEFKVLGQGEDVVAGGENVPKLKEMGNWNPNLYVHLTDVALKLEKMNKDVQDIEFTVQDGKLYILQTRNAKRTPNAALRIAMDLLDEGLIGLDDIPDRVSYEQFIQASKVFIPEEFKKSNPADVKGIAASSGCVSGVAVFSSEEALKSKEPCILITNETNPDDIAGMYASKGILTRLGGYTSHAAVVARGAGIAAVVGCSELENVEIFAGDRVTLDGDTGEVWVKKQVPIESGDKDLINAFSNRLINEYGIYKICDSLEDTKGVDRAVVSVADIQSDFEDGYDSGNVLGRMQEIIRKSDKETKLVVDLRNRSFYLNHKVELFFHNEDTPYDFLMALLDDLKNENVSVLGAGLTGKTIEDAKKHGIKFIKEVKSIADLINAKGLCQPQYDILSASCPKEDLLALLSLKERAGEQVKSFNIEYVVDKDVISRGMVFACGQYPFMASILK